MGLNTRRTSREKEDCNHSIFTAVSVILSIGSKGHIRGVVIKDLYPCLLVVVVVMIDSSEKRISMMSWEPQE